MSELKSQLLASRYDYNQLCNEIEHILSLNSSENFARLTQQWARLKLGPGAVPVATENTRPGSIITTTANMSSAELEKLIESVRAINAGSSLITSQEVELNRNIERLLEFDLKRAKAREEAEAAAAAAAAAAELERRNREKAEAEAAAAAAAAAAAEAAAALAAAQQAMEVDEETTRIKTEASPDKRSDRKSLETTPSRVTTRI